MLNYWFSSNDDICPDNYNYSRFQLKGKGRSEKWEVYLYGDMTIKVDSRFKLKGKCRSEKWEVYLDGAHDQYQEDVGCVCMLNGWISCYDVICADNYNFPVQVEGQGSQCEVGGVSVRCDRAEVLPRGVLPASLCNDWCRRWSRQFRPQLELLLDMVVDMPVGVQRLLLVSTCRKLRRSPQLQFMA